MRIVAHSKLAYAWKFAFCHNRFIYVPKRRFFKSSHQQRSSLRTMDCEELSTLIRFLIIIVKWDSREIPLLSSALLPSEYTTQLQSVTNNPRNKKKRGSDSQYVTLLITWRLLSSAMFASESLNEKKVDESSQFKTQLFDLWREWLKWKFLHRIYEAIKTRDSGNLSGTVLKLCHKWLWFQKLRFLLSFQDFLKSFQLSFRAFYWVLNFFSLIELKVNLQTCKKCYDDFLHQNFWFANSS